ncbi:MULTISPECIES: toprim domain-containing protein [Actinomadura]|uniref:Toprim domain-containing protein n=1 Tax=Actinomadura yumaensis TaxID=111807 RepID=A0ABW2CW19_9ACTN|nr:toprim domain-containing protein [Actinomadura sp. J1-007]MWK34060.1 toprim domain-containing protein [Actinomadura sp. J1-007]
MSISDEGVLRGIAEQETARLRDGTLPWSWWLERAARHGRYGYTNTLLIAAQWRAATDVRSYEEWRAAGRQVRKGETGIRILARRRGRVRAVFDVEQTEGLPLRSPPPADPEEVAGRLASLAARLGAGSGEPGPVGGTRDVWRIARSIAFRLGSGDPVEAESVAFLVLARFGLVPPHGPSPDPGTGGGAPWAGPRFGDRVLRLARTVHERASAADGLLVAAHRWFRGRLDGGWVPAYLAGRGFTPGVQRRWRIGYAPPGPHALTDHLRAAGYGDEEIVAAGLARPARRGRPYDTFRDRAMFAIRTAEGGIAGFIGRAPDGADAPKYLNGPDTELFHKGELLYGLHEARERLAGGARPVLVEGPLDAIAVAMAAPRDLAAVATCGAAFTPGQLAALRGAADLDRTGVLVALDGDAAGLSAALRVWEVLAGVRGPVDAVRFPPGSDPADALRAGGRDAVRDALRAREPLIDAVVDAAVRRSGGGLATPEERLAAIRSAASVIAGGRPHEAARQVVRVAARTGVGPATVTDALLDAVSPP